MKRVAVLGSTGSIGVSTLDVLGQHPDRYVVTALAAATNHAALLEQCLRFRPAVAVLQEPGPARALELGLRSANCPTQVWCGLDALNAVAAGSDVDVVMAAIVGAAGLPSTLAAARAGKHVLVANKESLVMAGALLVEAARRGGAVLVPIDSEHNASGRGLTLRHGIATSPFGDALIVQSARGIAFLAFADESGGFDGYDAFRVAWREATWEQDIAGARRIAQTIWTDEPAADRRLTLWVHGSNFQLQVWRALLAAGQHRTLSYQQLAQSIGRGSASRAVGTAVGANPVAWLIPCHHVLRANGALGGYRWGLERKQAMLAWEFARSVRNASRRRPSASPASAGSR